MEPMTEQQVRRSFVNCSKGDPRVRTWLEGVSGTVLVGLGLRVAVSSR